MDNTKYYKQVEKLEFNRMKSEFKMTIEKSTVYRFVNMYMLCIEDDEAIKEIMLTENEIKELREIFIPKSKNPMYVYFEFEYNAIKDVNQGRLEAGIAKELVEATKSQFEENNYIQLVREDMDKIRYRTLSGPRMHSCAGDRVEHEGVRSEYDSLAPGLSQKDIKPQSIFSFEILKMPDEWFWIEVVTQGVRMEKTQSYFKCDGFFGLKKLLQNVKIL